ncbi:MAG: flotillin family protein [bacterium]|nr:flotillin family protein [bacterium]
MANILQNFGFLVIIIGAIVVVGGLAMVVRCYRKVEQGKVLIRNGFRGSKVSFSGMVVLPVFHRSEVMDISVKRIEINRMAREGLICKDNLRADIKVVFFVRVNQTREDVLKVAQALGCEKASDAKILMEFFDAKFSEALKTVGKKFDFVQLYTEREHFKTEILQVIGTDLNGYVLDDAAIDYLEQTEKKLLNPDNILDAEGIKKITDLTAKQAVLSNEIDRKKEMTIVEQDVTAKEAVLELHKQQAEAEEKQKREVANITAREEAAAFKVEQEERLKAENARIATDEELAVAEENKNRQIIVAQKAKESTEAVEAERVEKKKLLEQTEKEKLVTLAEIAKEKSVEEERKLIQDVIRERVIVEKAVVIEEEKIKDTKAFAEAEREKKVAVTDAEKTAQETLITEVKAAEAAKLAAQLGAEQQLIEADANFKASQKEAEAVKTMADAKAEEEAVHGMAEVRVMNARADAIEKEGTARAVVVEKEGTARAMVEEKEGTAKATVLKLSATAEAAGIEAKATALAVGIEAKALAEAKGKDAMVQVFNKEGTVEASVMFKKYQAEAQGITEKANAMKLLDEAGKGHEEFKLELAKQKEVELAKVNIQKDIAESQASVIREALKSAKIDIVGGETMFFDKIVGAITQGKSVDRMVDNSKVLGDVKETFFNGDPEYFQQQLQHFVSKFNMSSEDMKNLSLSALLGQMMTKAEGPDKAVLQRLMSFFGKDAAGA